MLDTIEAVDAKHLQTAIPNEEIGTSDVMVVIGDENEEGPYRNMSFVLTRYGPSGGTGGTIGVLGPTRMDYSDTVAHVRYVSEVLTELMRGFYGENE
jgi:heat-inducible transcriptional repressor